MAPLQLLKTLSVNLIYALALGAALVPCIASGTKFNTPLAIDFYLISPVQGHTYPTQTNIPFVIGVNNAVPAWGFGFSLEYTLYENDNTTNGQLEWTFGGFTSPVYTNYTTPTIDATTFIYYGINDTLLPEGDWNVVLSVSVTTCTESSDEITWNSGPVGSTQITFSTANDGTELEELVPQGGGTPGNGLGNVELYVGSQISSGCPILGTPPQGAIQLAVGSTIISYAPSPTPIFGLSTSTTSFVSSTGTSPASSESSTGSSTGTPPSSNGKNTGVRLQRHRIAVVSCFIGVSLLTSLM
jgi:hypothetical protein